MALLHGKIGKVVWNAEDGNGSDVDILHVTRWGMDATCDTSETTAMNDTWKTRLPGFVEWRATVECWADTTRQIAYDNPGGGFINTAVLGEDYAPPGGGQKAFLELWFTQTASDGLLYGPAICVGERYESSHDGICKVVYDFTSFGEVLFKTTEPTDFSEPLS